MAYPSSISLLQRTVSLSYYPKCERTPKDLSENGKNQQHERKLKKKQTDKQKFVIQEREVT